MRVLTDRPASGAVLRTQPGKTTTVLGSHASDMMHVVGRLGNVKSTHLGSRPNGFNLLNVPDHFYRSPSQFWREYDAPWLSNAVGRGDPIVMATRPTFTPDASTGTSLLIRIGPATGQRTLSGFAREYLYLRRHGYAFDEASKRMIPRRGKSA